jgi:hypothetical protein
MSVFYIQIIFQIIFFKFINPCVKQLRQNPISKLFIGYYWF